MLINVGPSVRTLAAIALVYLAAIGVFAQNSNSWSPNTSPLAPPTGMVNDYAGVIDDAAKQQLETRLRQFKEKTGVELAVAVVRTTGERDIFDYSLAVARGWKIGSKQDDNPGALMLVAIDDRKYVTQVSRDLEDELTDGIAGSLQRQYLVPEFKKGNYAKGIADTMDAYMRTIESRLSGATPTPVAGVEDGEGRGAPQSIFSTFCCLAVILFIVLIIWSNRGGGGRNRRGGGWGGGFGGGGSALPWIIGSAIANAASSSSSSSSSSDWGSGGSSWGGGGGGGDWGGFGGGGDFGGGGAGGSW